MLMLVAAGFIGDAFVDQHHFGDAIGFVEGDGDAFVDVGRLDVPAVDQLARAVDRFEAAADPLARR
jgi:hypothetical protein